MITNPLQRARPGVPSEVVVAGLLVLTAAVLGLLVFATLVLVRRARRGTLRRDRNSFVRAGDERGHPLGEAYERGNASSAWTRTTP